jgi:F-type H+-transporting ATPase subunit gamma
MQSLLKNLTKSVVTPTVSLSVVPSYNFGANLKTLKLRMKSVGSIKKITKAMKMVAAAKMRVEINRLERG